MNVSACCGYVMTDPFEDTTAQLQRLVAEVAKETDSAKCDELCAEIWRVLGERERLRPIHASLTPPTHLEP
jgi:hypothetical protein